MYLFVFNVRTGEKSTPSALPHTPRPPPHHLTLFPSFSVSDQLRGPLGCYICQRLLSSHTLCLLGHWLPFPRLSLLLLGCPGFLRAPPSPPLLVPMQAWKENYSCGSSLCCLCLRLPAWPARCLPVPRLPPILPIVLSCHPAVGDHWLGSELAGTWCSWTQHPVWEERGLWAWADLDSCPGPAT